MSTSPKYIHHRASWLLGIYLMVLGLLAVHPWHGEEIHHSDHVCVEETHYHAVPDVCELCDVVFTPVDYSDIYTLERVYAQEHTVLYEPLTTNTFTTDHYRCLLRGPPSA